MASYGLFSYKTRIFILLWVFLQEAVVSFGGDLLSIYFKRTDLPSPAAVYWPTNYLLGGGGIVGGIFILILSNSLDVKNHYWLVRCVQIVQLSLLIVLYQVQSYDWGQQYSLPSLSAVFFLQGAAESMSRILSPIYIMSTICDRDLEQPVAFLLLINTQLPIYLSAFFAQLLSINRLFLTVGVGVFSGLFCIVLFFSIFLPKTVQGGKEHENSEYVECWHLQFEEERGRLGPMLTLSSLGLTAQLSGHHLFMFYDSWTLRLATHHLQPGLFTSFVSFLSLLLALITWTSEKLPYFLVVSTGVLAVCSFLCGILLHGLEAGSSVPEYGPPILRLVFTVAWSVGLGSLPDSIGALITPRRYRLSVFGLSRALTSGAGLISEASLSTLISLLHPFGVFWLYSVILILGLVYISLGVLGQLRPRKYPSPPLSSSPTLQEFITQV